MTFREKRKPRLADIEFTGNQCNADYSQHELDHVYAVGKIFEKSSFKQSTFVGCYLRNCRFIDCDFTGAFIKETNLRGTQFENCNFKYVTWEKSQVDDDFLDYCLPSEENLARDLVRSLRVNFTEIGNYEAVNRAASVEVQLTGRHLYKAAYSKESYYRAKYKGLQRLSHAARHAQWKALDLLWGNGESLLRIFFNTALLLLAMAFLHSREANISFQEALFEFVWQFWGKQYAQPIPPNYAIALAIAQFVTFGLFMAVLVKRLSRR
jgi:uncharacterized protein YjbI with pentapeptide repeats